jgi:outer membrane protein OmpA-like peptidoglycan-associated protein
MKSKLILLGTVAGLSIISAANSNAHNQGWYVGIEAGANWIGDNDFAFSDDYGSDEWSIASLDMDYGYGNLNSMSFDTGWAALGTIGYGFEKNWRVEFEVGYRSNDVDAFFAGKSSWSAVTTESTPRYDIRSAEFDEWTFMVNVVYDIPLTDKLDLNIGVGAGADLADFDDNSSVNDDDWNFAYQGIVGLSYALNDRLDVTLTYRYLNVDSPSFSGVREGYHGPVNERIDLDDVEKHSLTVGLRWDLHADEAPVVVAPPVVPPQPAAEPEQFVIFFGFNKCNITAEADAVLSEAASAAKTTGAASILIVGHTDTVGSNSYNQKLSDCRASAAKSGLVSKGINEGQISASGRGETELLVKTGDNVKEPQNRRATIDLQN